MQILSGSEKKIHPIRWIISGFVCFWVMLGFVYFNTGQLRAMEVISHSMEPTIQVGDRVIVRAFVEGDPQPGEVVVLESPTDEGPELVKRVLAVPGDIVEMEDGYLYVNGKRDYNASGVASFFPDAPDYKIRVPEDRYFLVGDNRLKSYDSTEFGPVDRSLINGRVIFRYSPWARRGSIE